MNEWVKALARAESQIQLQVKCVETDEKACGGWKGNESMGTGRIEGTRGRERERGRERNRYMNWKKERVKEKKKEKESKAT